MSEESAAGTVEMVEIRLILDRTDPPVGRLRLTGGAGPDRDEDPEYPFTGWLGLLRALYLVTGGGPEKR